MNPLLLQICLFVHKNTFERVAAGIAYDEYVEGLADNDTKLKFHKWKDIFLVPTL